MDTLDARADRITLVGLIFESASALRRELMPPVDLELAVSGQALDILIRLHRSPGSTLRMSDLAAQTGISPSGLTRALDRLEAAGLCRRELCPEDRRGTFAQLTELGATRMAAAIELHRKDIDTLLDDLFTPEEERQLASLLERIRDRVHPLGAQLSDPGGFACPATGTTGPDPAG